MLAKMIDKIVSLKETKTFEIGGQTYTDGHLTRIPPHVDRPEAISVSGLDGVCNRTRGFTSTRALRATPCRASTVCVTPLSLVLTLFSSVIRPSRSSR